MSTILRDDNEDFCGEHENVGVLPNHAQAEACSASLSHRGLLFIGSLEQRRCQA